MKKIFIAFCLFSCIILPISAAADLVDRGNGLIYDPDQNITWMQNAGHIGGSWHEAMNWADKLIYAGHDDWRLPKTLVPDNSCENKAEAAGMNCHGSEMGYLFYVYEISSSNPGPFVDLLGVFYWSSSDTLLAPGYDMGYTFAFGDNHIPHPFEPGYQELLYKEATWGLGAWAVADGDITVNMTPEPISSLLFLAGGATLAFHRYRRRK